MEVVPKRWKDKRSGEKLSLDGVEMTLHEHPLDEQAGAWLEARKEGRVRHYPILVKEFLIGRASHCHLVLDSDRRFISREHALITHAKGRYWISDLSINGTWLNGSRLTRLRQEPLHDGDAITLEDWEFTFHLNSDSAALTK